MKSNGLLHTLSKCLISSSLFFILTLKKKRGENMKWEKQIEKYKEFSKQCKEMLEQSNKNKENYKKSLEVFKNGRKSN